MRLYRTAKGKWVAERVERTCWQGEHDQHEAIVTYYASTVINFYGMGRTAKELYAAAGFDCTEYVE
jgi:hypothetical protein